VRSTSPAMAACLAAALAGCATPEPATVLAAGPRMIDLYRGTTATPVPAGRDEPGTAPGQIAPWPAARSVPHTPRRPGPEVREAAKVVATCDWGGFRWRCEAPAPPTAACACDDTRSYARTAANELDLLFPRLPNPDVFIYVPPHLATTLRIPVPGYTTAVPLYDRVEYALPGEADTTRGPGETRGGASPEDTQRIAPPEAAGAGTAPQGTRPDASPGAVRAGTHPKAVRSDAPPDEARRGAGAPATSLGASPEDVPPDANRKKTRSGAEAAQPDMSPQGTRPETPPPEAARSGADPQVWLGTRPAEVPPSVCPKEAPPGARAEHTPPGLSPEAAPCP